MKTKRDKKDASVECFKHSLGRTAKITRNIMQDSQFCRQDSNRLQIYM